MRTVAEVATVARPGTPPLPRPRRREIARRVGRWVGEVAKDMYSSMISGCVRRCWCIDVVNFMDVDRLLDSCLRGFCRRSGTK